jgi:hypothetical protein
VKGASEKGNSGKPQYVQKLSAVRKFSHLATFQQAASGQEGLRPTPNPPNGSMHNSKIKANISELSEKKILRKISGCSGWKRTENCRNVTE